MTDDEAKRQFFEKHIIPRVREVLDMCKTAEIGALFVYEWAADVPLGDFTHYRGFTVKAVVEEHPMIAKFHRELMDNKTIGDREIGGQIKPDSPTRQ